MVCRLVVRYLAGSTLTECSPRATRDGAPPLIAAFVLAEERTIAFGSDASGSDAGEDWAKVGLGSLACSRKSFPAKLAVDNRCFDRHPGELPSGSAGCEEPRNRRKLSAAVEGEHLFSKS